jgi:hypothetical protein
MSVVLFCETPTSRVRKRCGLSRRRAICARTANQATQLEDETSNEERNLEIAVSVYLAPKRLERRPVPANLVDGVEFVGDPWDGGRQDCLATVSFSLFHFILATGPYQVQPMPIRRNWRVRGNGDTDQEDA